MIARTLRPTACSDAARRAVRDRWYRPLALPPLVPMYGTGVLFLALAAFSLATLAMLPFLPAYPVAAECGVTAKALPIARKPLATTLAAIFLFQAGNMGLAAFIIGLGRNAGLSQDFIGPTLAAANWLGAVGSILVVAMGARFGRAKPILGSIVVTLIFTAAFWRSDIPPSMSPRTSVRPSSGPSPSPTCSASPRPSTRSDEPRRSAASARSSDWRAGRS
ncbi:MFS transporter [Sphingopyxis terrae]|uniref:hypothetical protein n=1 Tax=Sphingopyxis terrae TaxID=33052 RepID=UPI00364137C6